MTCGPFASAGAVSLLSSCRVLSFDFLSQESDSVIRETNYMDHELPQFMGNRTHCDFFKLLKQDGLSVLVGARNMVYNLSLPDLTENQHEVIHCMYYRTELISWRYSNIEVTLLYV